MGIRPLIRGELGRLDPLFQALGGFGAVGHPANGGITGDLDPNAQAADSQCGSERSERDR
ncbi:hypothetical protein Halru_0238 [Halovivax ruber XH-70]|uniref:Uncharacterized protein n=1 Tax=Halovivax ruber (strain DSM 18193 / JCM 13892 / XH-70) TaxID=797302 RepID=L0I872_HALRX|nr:hypothetical protein Halru_0238 [Halovivax ruber XH-70]